MRLSVKFLESKRCIRAQWKRSSTKEEGDDVVDDPAEADDTNTFDLVTSKPSSAKGVSMARKACSIIAIR
jgi:hypothetical protein